MTNTNHKKECDAFIEFIADFFKDNSNSTQVNVLSFQNILLLILTALAIFYLYKKKDELKKWKHRHTVRYVFGVIFLANMLISYLVFTLTIGFDWKEHLPLHLCFITGYFFIAILFTDNKKLYRIVYFFTFIGPLPAILFPNIPIEIFNYFTYYFVISHHLILIISLYCMFVLDYTVSKKDLILALFIALVLIFSMMVFNDIFGTNYIMTSELPEHITKMFPFTTNIDMTLLWLSIAGVIAVAVAYIPIHLVTKNEDKINSL